MITCDERKIDQKVTSNVLQFFTNDGTKISIRPSGTEPKMKFYFEVKEKLNSRADYDREMCIRDRRSIHPFDSAIGIDWQLGEIQTLVSGKDMKAPFFKEAEMNFKFGSL